MKVLNRQSLLDIALQETGRVEEVINIALINDLRISDDIDEGIEILMPSVKDNVVYKYYKVNNICPATSILAGSKIVTGGIGFMGVEMDLIVN